MWKIKNNFKFCYHILITKTFKVNIVICNIRYIIYQDAQLKVIVLFIRNKVVGIEKKINIAFQDINK